MERRVCDHAEIKNRPVTLRMQAHLPLRGNQALRDQTPSKPDTIEQIERRRVKGRSAQIGFDVGGFFEQRSGDAFTRKQQSRDKTHRPAAYDGHLEIAIRVLS